MEIVPGPDFPTAATILVAAIAVSYRDLRQHYRVAPAIEDLTVACHGKPGRIPLQSLLFKRPEWVALMEGKASDPTAWPDPFRDDPTHPVTWSEVSPGHHVRMAKGGL